MSTRDQNVKVTALTREKLRDRVPDGDQCRACGGRGDEREREISDGGIG